MRGSRSATTGRRSRPQPRKIAETTDKELRPGHIPTLPVPDRIAGGQASPKAWPLLFGTDDRASGSCSNPTPARCFRSPSTGLSGLKSSRRDASLRQLRHGDRLCRSLTGEVRKKPRPRHGNAWILVSAFGGRTYSELSYTLDRDDHVLLIGRLLS